MGYLIATVALLLIGWLAGGAAERKHFRDLAAAERRLEHVLVTDLKQMHGAAPDAGAALVSGEVVIANDYLKMFLAGLRNIFGGKVESYQTLMERARREALVRLRQAAVDAGFDTVANFRIEMSRISAQAFAVLAWGTAYRRG